MMVCHDRKFVFVSTPKAATHSMYQTLRSSFNVQLKTLEDSRMHCNILDPNTESYYKFTVVRNPFSRAVSSWWQIIKNSKQQTNFKDRYFDQYDSTFQSFTSFLLELETFGQHPRMFDSQHFWHNGITFDTILKLESIQKDYNCLPFVKGGVVTHNFSLSGERNEWRQYYTQQDYDNVMIAYKDDFDIFGFKYE
jgi:hypothetical protein